MPKPEVVDSSLSIAVEPLSLKDTTTIPPSYSEVSNSNVFGAIKSNTTTPTQSAVPAANTNLKLVAVNESSNGDKLAIIEDVKSQAQDVFSVSEKIFGGGKLVEIGPDSVKIDRGGRIEILALAEGGPSTSGGDPSELNQTDFSIADDEISSALANLPQLLSQARAVPYFRNGTSIGMRLFAIKPESLYEKLGLKNGDIILSVNENSLSDPAQALKLFEQLKTERAINVKLERNSQVSEMRYSIR
jgi:general secretion pathway protein C